MTKGKVYTHDKQRHAGSNAVILSPDERRAQGKALRDAAPREAQGGWKPPRTRRDRVQMLIESNEGRLAELMPIHFGRMLQSPFAFYRGAAAIMAADLATTPSSGVRVQACGDAHLLNFGGFATPERQIVFDINDLDETLPALWEWDLKRLTASMVIAAHHLRLSESEAARAATATVHAYRERMADYSSARALDVWYDRISIDRVLAEAPTDAIRNRIAKRLQKARQQSSPEYIFPKLVEQHGTVPRIKDSPPLIYHPADDIAPGLETQYREQLAENRESLSEHVRVLYDRFHFCDLAIKVVGVGSVGTRCAVILLMAAENDPLFLQGKEARAHARSGDAALIAGYMGANATFDDAICEFAMESSDQNQRDYRAFVKAVREGRIEVVVETA